MYPMNPALTMIDGATEMTSTCGKPKVEKRNKGIVD